MASEQTLVEDSLYEEKREQMMDEQPQKEKIGIIDLPGVGAATAEKLEVAGFRDIMSIAVATPAELVDASGISLPVAKKMIAAARATADMGFISGVDILQKRSKIKKLQTGCPSLDNLLGGGFETASIVECFGEFGSGKTQIGHLLAVQTQKLSDDAAVVYIDTENTFRPERIQQLAKGAGLDPEKVLKNIKVARAYNSDHQMLLAEKVDDIIKKQGLNVKAVIVDSLTAHFRAEFIGRGTLADRQQKLNKHMHVLAKLATLNNLVVYVTNQVMARPDVFFGDPTESIGGHIVAHNSTFRMYLRRGKKNTRVAKLGDSSHLPDSECGFVITTDGLRDI